MAVKVCKALSAAISLCCRELGTCQCERVRLRLRRAACEAHTFFPIELQSLSSPFSGEILAECPPFICSLRHSSSPNDPHFSIFYTPEMGTAPTPYFSSYFTPFYPFVFVFSHSCIFTPNACWVVDCLKYFEVCRHFIIPRDPGDQSSGLSQVFWAANTRRRLRDVSLHSLHSKSSGCRLNKSHFHFKDQNRINCWYNPKLSVDINLTFYISVGSK